MLQADESSSSSAIDYRPTTLGWGKELVSGSARALRISSTGLVGSNALANGKASGLAEREAAGACLCGPNQNEDASPLLMEQNFCCRSRTSWRRQHCCGSARSRPRPRGTSHCAVSSEMCALSKRLLHCLFLFPLKRKWRIGVTRIGLLNLLAPQND